MRALRALVLLATLSAASCAWAQSLLPQSFAGWTRTSDVTTVKRAAEADSANAAVLDEYGFLTQETATYARQNGAKLTVKADRFKDATGAYGAFTFYRDPAMKSEKVGTKAASSEGQAIFFRDNVVVDAVSNGGNATAAELRELAASLPEAKGVEANLPGLPEYLPKQNALENSAKYVLGAQALAATKLPLPAELVGFQFDPEILSQDYTTPEGPVTLMLVEYPTPQIAIEQLRKFEASGNFPAARRTGPILVIESGKVESEAAKRLLNAVNYQAEITWNEATSISKKDNVGNLLLAVFALIGILLLIGVGFGLLMGGLRVILSKYFPGTVLDTPENVEILQLHLEDHPTSNK